MLLAALAACGLAAPVTWSSGVVSGDAVVSNRGTLVEACNFGNATTTSPTVNGVPFTAIDFASGGSPGRLVGLTYNTGEGGKLQGAGVNELADTIAYRSGVDPQHAELTGLSVGTAYEVQFFYYHDSVNRSVTILDGSGNNVTLSESGEPVYATGTFTADATTQSFSFDANTGSQFLNAYQLRETEPVTPLLLGEVVISEFGASNEAGIVDGDGNFPDWIEIWNSTEDLVDLDGWYLSVTGGWLDGWSFPAVVLEPGGFLVVFASGQAQADSVDAGGNLHTNFTLAKGGGYLALVKPDGAGGHEIVSEFTSYPPQETDVSYGLYGIELPLGTGYLDRLTPGAPNSEEGFGGFVGDTAFSQDRGFYDASIMVTIGASNGGTITPGAIIRYTTDGSEPTLDNGMDYPGFPGILVEKTTVLRAAAFKEGLKPTNVDTQTYLFVDDVVDQPASPPGFPTTWTGADYGMEQDASDLALIAGDTGLSRHGGEGGDRRCAYRAAGDVARDGCG